MVLRARSEPQRQRSRAAAKAGKSRAGGELSEVKRQLRQLAADVLDGTVDKARGSVVAQILGVYLRAEEVARKVKEAEVLEERVVALERLARETKGGRRRWG